MLIALVIFFSAVPVVRSAGRILLQSAPAMVSVAQIRRQLLQVHEQGDAVKGCGAWAGRS